MSEISSATIARLLQTTNAPSLDFLQILHFMRENGLNSSDGASRQSGGPTGTTDAPTEIISNYHGIIRFSKNTADSIFAICKPLYEKGCSIREIEKQTGIPKTTVRETLTAHGFTLRNFQKDKTAKPKRPSAMRGGTIPYGYAYLEGQLVKHPTEFTIVLKVMKLWTSGKSSRAIAKQLNAQKVATRLGKSWTHSVINSIIKRQLDFKKKEQ
jgi:hypothetical protein